MENTVKLMCITVHIVCIREGLLQNALNTSLATTHDWHTIITLGNELVLIFNWEYIIYAARHFG